MRNSCFFDQHHSPNSAVFILRQAKKLKPQYISNNCQTTSWNLMPILVCVWGGGGGSTLMAFAMSYMELERLYCPHIRTTGENWAILGVLELTVV